MITGGVDNVYEHSHISTGTTEIGKTVKVKTTIADAYKKDYYVRGFSFNGVTYNLLQPNDSGEYTDEFTIKDNFTDDYLEITPIYYYRHKTDDKNYVQFYIENYDETLQATGWGNTLYVYPYYADAQGKSISSVGNAYGGYPGQPVINYGGRRSIEIPTTFTRGEITGSIKGVTLSNGFWDIVHREYVNAVPDHKQTYDYDDFYKIYKETSDGKEVNGKKGVVDQITFVFKYRTATNNFSDSTNTANDSNYTVNGDIRQPYSSFTEAEKTTKFKNGWEPLLDYHDRPVDLFGKQLTDEQKGLDPVLVVSDDYKVTYAGYYATTWTVYARTSTDATTYTKIAEIAPSALIVTEKERLKADAGIYPAVEDRTGYPQTTGTQLADYAGVYETLGDYRGYPVQITYESAIENNSEYEKYYHFTKTEGDNQYDNASEVAIRSDGRWLYSYYDDEITANIKIEYKNDENAVSWTEDSFKTGTNTGETTGASAYFTNEDFKGRYDTTGVDIVSDPKKNFTFTATKPSGYIFQGWWLERDGKVTRISDNDVLNGVSAMTSNATFVARYVKAPTGTLMINHTLSNDSTGSGKTYISVYVYKEEDYTNGRFLTKPDVEGNQEEDHFVENQFEIGSEYISYNSTDWIQIVLRTKPSNKYSIFTGFTASENNNEDYKYVAVDETYIGDYYLSQAIDVKVADLFSTTEDGFPQQKFDVLSYSSELATYNYRFKFEYPAYVEAYGTLGYVAEGRFTQDDFDDYMVVNADGKLEFREASESAYDPDNPPTDDGPPDGETTGSGDLKVNFLNLIAPYEDNFMTTIRWDTKNVDTMYDAATRTITVKPKAGETEGVIEAETETRDIDITFKFPYAINEDDYTPKKDENGDINKLDDNGYAMTYTAKTGYGQVFSLNNHKYNYDENNKLIEEEDAPDLIEAPKVIYDNDGIPLYFRHWKITACSHYNTAENNHKEVEYTHSFNYKFDYVLFQDSTVEPVYSKLEGDEKAPTPNSERAKDNVGVTITFMENSRNQYNGGFSGNMKDDDKLTSRLQQGDRIYTDFLISTNNVIKDEQDNIIQLNTLDEEESKKYEVGLVIERVGELDKDPNFDDSYVVCSEGEYKTLYGTNLSSDLSKKTGGETTYNDVKNFILGDTGNGFLKSNFSVYQLNNKNRVNYYYTLPNRNHSDLEVSPYQYQIYRAYAYIVDGREGEGQEKVYISNVPVYFTIYEMGSIENYGDVLGSEYLPSNEEDVTE